MEKIYKMKGICEHCGHAYAGTADLTKLMELGAIECPVCKESSQNNDEANAIDDLNEAEGEFGFKGEYVEAGELKVVAMED